ncbi:hypothetical protein ZWY2020_035481 [Hordeum vulgare]|nr:hypothetical protein ZWY2020_035481 [Hordeum vulgare]
MWRDEGVEDEETLRALLEASRTREGRAALSDALADTLHLLPASRAPLLLLRLRLLRNLVAGDALNQGTFVLLSGPAAVVSVALSLPSLSPDLARAALQALGNAALGGDRHREAVWDALFPGALRDFARVRDADVLDPLCMVLDTCCSGDGGRGRVEELCHEDVGLPVLVELVTTASRLGHKEEWLEWLLFKICVEEEKFEALFAALDSTDVSESGNGFSANHAFLMGELEPPSTIRKAMAKEQGDQQQALATAKVCPYNGYRRDLVAVIANCLQGRKQVQDEVRQLNGIMLLLQQCVIDEGNAYLREWGLLAVKKRVIQNWSIPPDVEISYLVIDNVWTYYLDACLTSAHDEDFSLWSCPV